MDDLIYTGNDFYMLNDFKQSIMSKLEMSDLEIMNYFLGIEVYQSVAGIFITQNKYVWQILDKFLMDCNPVDTPIKSSLKMVKDSKRKKFNSILYKQVIGSLLYLNCICPIEFIL